MRNFALLFVLFAALVFGAAGCATTDPDAESDIPWNTPQPWESAPTIPGLDQR